MQIISKFEFFTATSVNCLNFLLANFLLLWLTNQVQVKHAQLHTFLPGHKRVGYYTRIAIIKCIAIKGKQSTRYY